MPDKFLLMNQVDAGGSARTARAVLINTHYIAMAYPDTREGDRSVLVMRDGASIAVMLPFETLSARLGA